MSLGSYAEALTLLGDENRLRLCVLLAERELCVSDLVRVTGLAQPRVSTHLARMREAGLLRHRRRGAQTFYGLSRDGLSGTLLEVLNEVASSSDRTLLDDQQRLTMLDAERRDGLAESAIVELDRDYSPGRTWQSLALGHAALLDLGDVLDVGSGDGAAASVIAPHCRSLTCIDTDARCIDAAQDRLARYPNARALVADVHALSFDDASFDEVLMFHTLTYTEQPSVALAESARVLRPGGRLVILCLDEYEDRDHLARYGMIHHGFSPRRLRSLMRGARIDVAAVTVACREARKPYLRVVLGQGRKPPAERDTLPPADEQPLSPHLHKG